MATRFLLPRLGLRGLCPAVATPATASALALVVQLCGCSHKPEEPAAEHKEASRIERGTNHEVILRLDAQTQKAMDLQTEALKPAELSREIKGYGRIMDASSLAALAAELKTAQAISQASQAEWTRLKGLAAQNNASQRALEAAESAALRDQAQLEAVRLRLAASWGGAISRRADLAAFAESLAKLEAALAQLTLPAGETLPVAPIGARIATLGQTNPLAAQLLGPAPAIDPQSQGLGYLVLVSSNTTQLTPGAAITGFLTLPGEKERGLALPAGAVVRFNGLTWVYAQTGEETFERKAVTLETPLEQGWFLRRGLQPGDKVVVSGAQQLLSEELKRDEAE
jgi:hypothetical protein